MTAVNAASAIADEPIVALKPPVGPEAFEYKNLRQGEFWRHIPAYEAVDEKTFLDHIWQGRHSVKTPDELLSTIQKLASPDFIEDAKRGFILDGFPRTLAQASALEAMLAAKGLKLDAAIELTADAPKLVERIVRRAQEASAAGQPVRKDDDPEVFKSRLAAYERDTAAVTPFYRERGLLHEVDGMAPIQDVAKAIDSVLSVVAAA